MRKSPLPLENFVSRNKDYKIQVGRQDRSKVGNRWHSLLIHIVRLDISQILFEPSPSFATNPRLYLSVIFVRKSSILSWHTLRILYPLPIYLPQFSLLSRYSFENSLFSSEYKLRISLSFEYGWTKQIRSETSPPWWW